MAAGDYSDAALAAALSGGGGAGQRATSPGQLTGPVPGQYFDRRVQYGPDDLETILRSLPPEKVAKIQSQMQASGLLPKTFRSFGFIDATTRSEFANVLDMANGRGFTYEQTLNELEIGGKALLDEQRREEARAVVAGRVKTYERSDPAGVRQTAEAAFRQALGRKPKKDELERFVSGFLGRERQSQDAVFAAQDRVDDANEAATQAAAGQAGGAAAGALTATGAGSESDVLWANLQRMIADAPGKITPGKRSRSLAEQEALWAKYQNGTGALAAKPGTSKHGNGRANDLKYENQATKRWALENAHKYGLSFPLLKHGEDWHIELADGHSTSDGHNHGAPGGPVVVGDQAVTVQRQDLGAQAIEYARNVNPDETAAYDVGQQFNTLLSIINKGVGV